MKHVFLLTFALLTFLPLQISSNVCSTSNIRKHSIYHRKRTNSDLNYINKDKNTFYLGTENYYIEFDASLFGDDSTFTTLPRNDSNSTGNIDYTIKSAPSNNNEHTFSITRENKVETYTINLHTLGISKDNDIIKIAFNAIPNSSDSSSSNSKWFLLLVAPPNVIAPTNEEDNTYFDYVLQRKDPIISTTRFSTFITQQFLYEFSKTISICLICAGVIIGVGGSYHTLFTLGTFFCCMIYLIIEEAVILTNNPIQEIQFGTFLVVASLILGFALGVFSSNNLVPFHPALYGSAITFVLAELFVIFFDMYNPVGYVVTVLVLMILAFVAVKFLLVKQFWLRHVMVLSSCFVGSYLVMSGVAYTVGGLCNFKALSLEGMDGFNSNGAKGKLLYGVLLVVLLVLTFIGQNMYLENVESEVCPVKTGKDAGAGTVLVSLNKQTVFGEDPSVRLSHGPNHDVSEAILHNQNKTFELMDSRVDNNDDENNQIDEDMDERGIEEEDGDNEYDS